MIVRTSAIRTLVRRLTGVDLEAARHFLFHDSFVRRKGFYSQYAREGAVSCTTSAICIYALSETGQLSHSQKREFARVLLAFRVTTPVKHVGAFPRTTGAEPNSWTTSQAALALLSLGTEWKLIRPTVEWLLTAQATNGGWNFPGTRDGHERLIYTLYPAIVLLRCRARLGQACKTALSRIAGFVESSEEQSPFWIPLKRHLRALTAGTGKQSEGDLTNYGRLFEDRWPVERVDEDWLSNRFSMALMCGSNYLLLRRELRADHPLALLHIRYLADERLGVGWSDQHEGQAKIWATAVGALTLYRWGWDLSRLSTRLTRLPTHLELLRSLRRGTGQEKPESKYARSLMRRFSELRSGTQHALRYQTLIGDVFVFLFGSVLKDLKSESKTFFGTQRRDVTFRNAADGGHWSDWKNEHHILSVLIECKNKMTLSYDDLRQTACYLGTKMGRLGIVACRKTTPESVREILNWFVNNDDKYILIVNDDSLMEWIKLRDHGEDPTNAIADLYRSLREGSQ